jgi:hypothetical protein
MILSLNIGLRAASTVWQRFRRVFAWSDDWSNYHLSSGFTKKKACGCEEKIACFRKTTEEKASLPNRLRHGELLAKT